MRSLKLSVAFAVFGIAALGCGKKSDNNGNSTASNTPVNGTTSGDTSNQIPITGTLAISALHLADNNVSHVVALDTETGATSYAEIGTDGSFQLNVDKDKPWVVGYVDDTKTGADMLVSSFEADTLDTLNPGADTTSVELGNVDTSGEKAKTDLTTADLLTAIGMSAEGAETIGAVDDASLRYSNPDIDNNGKVDAVESKAYIIDFHNRFTAKTAAGAVLTASDLKNAFYPDDVVFSYTGTGIFPQIPPDDVGGSAPASYEWSFSVAMPTANNGGQVCSGMSADQDIPAGTACELTYQDNTGADGSSLTFGMETANLKAGDYTLKVGGKTYVWKNVAVSDFSAGDGFLALFTRIDVDNAGKITGISYKWQKKGADGTYSLATSEDINLIVKSSDDDGKYGGYVSMKYKDDESKGVIGVAIPKKPEGSIVFADAIGDATALNVQGSELTEDMVKAGVNFSDFTGNFGISYDDKLGMRFFF